MCKEHDLTARYSLGDKTEVDSWKSSNKHENQLY